MIVLFNGVDADEYCINEIVIKSVVKIINNCNEVNKYWIMLLKTQIKEKDVDFFLLDYEYEILTILTITTDKIDVVLTKQKEEIINNRNKIIECIKNQWQNLNEEMKSKIIVIYNREISNILKNLNDFMEKTKNSYKFFEFYIRKEIKKFIVIGETTLNNIEKEYYNAHKLINFYILGNINKILSHKDALNYNFSWSILDNNLNQLINIEKIDKNSNKKEDTRLIMMFEMMYFMEQEDNDNNLILIKNMKQCITLICKQFYRGNIKFNNSGNVETGWITSHMCCFSKYWTFVKKKKDNLIKILKDNCELLKNCGLLNNSEKKFKNGKPDTLWISLAALDVFSRLELLNDIMLGDIKKELNNINIQCYCSVDSPNSHNKSFVSDQTSSLIELRKNSIFSSVTSKKLGISCSNSKESSQQELQQLSINQSIINLQTPLVLLKTPKKTTFNRKTTTLRSINENSLEGKQSTSFVRRRSVLKARKIFNTRRNIIKLLQTNRNLLNVTHGKSDKMITEIQKELNEVKKIMRENIKDVIKNEGKLSSLNRLAYLLKCSAKDFEDNSQKIKDFIQNSYIPSLLFIIMVVIIVYEIIKTTKLEELTKSMDFVEL